MPTAAVIVAHPDDEVLWCGGLILQRPTWDWFILTLCRGDDSDRSTRFRQVLNYLGAQGEMANLDDGVEQTPLDPSVVRHVIREGLPRRAYDLVVTHGPAGEYTRHRRHEECYQAVMALWTDGQLRAGQLKLFAYDDQEGTKLPQARANADELQTLDADIFSRKYHIITKLYGFNEQSWEARTTPRIEGFSRIETPDQAEDLFNSPSPPDVDELGDTLPWTRRDG